MRLGAALLMVAVSTGCVHGGQGALISTRAGVQEVQAPVVCGPIGFRKTPLQARWGEYVKVTVTAQTALKGTVLVHAGGVAREPQDFVADGAGAVVIDARFPNEDPDRRFALERERPIDITLTTLEGTCEGAVFTVEQGALVPDVTDQAWIAELVRRGGPELAARREAAQREADARREAHYAEWATRQVEVSADVLAQQEEIRLAHYAAYENSLSPRSGERGLAADVSVAASMETHSATAFEAAPQTQSAVAAAMIEQPAQGSAVAIAVATGSSSGAVAGVSSPSAVATSTTPVAVAGSSVGSQEVVATSAASVSVEAPPSVHVEATASLGLDPFSDVTTARPQVAAQGVVVSSPSEWHSYEAALAVNASTWSAPPAPSADWVQPYQPSLQPVAVNSETTVPCPPGTEPVGHVEVVAPGVINLLLNVAAGLTVIQGQQVHAAQPVR